MMGRRFFCSLISMGPAILAGKSGEVVPSVVDVRKHPEQVRKYRASLDGVDISHKCFYADAQRGIARCNKLNAQGRPYVENFHLATEELRGRVVIRGEPWLRQTG